MPDDRDDDSAFTRPRGIHYDHWSTRHRHGRAVSAARRRLLLVVLVIVLLAAPVVVAVMV